MQSGWKLDKWQWAMISCTSLSMGVSRAFTGSPESAITVMAVAMVFFWSLYVGLQSILER